MTELKQLHIYTDGSCLGNPGPGGYGVVMKYKRQQKELSAGFKLTTNNRMELLAPIIALESLFDKVSEVICLTKSSNKIPVFLYLECFIFILAGFIINI